MPWNRAQRRLANLPTDVYRVYDASGQLLYVGASVNVFTRLRQHRGCAPWWADAHEATVARYADRSIASHVEAVAIRDEHPKWNVVPETNHARLRLRVPDPIEVLDLFWEDGKVWVDAS